MTVDLRDETAAEVNRRLRAGDFATADEVVAAGLRALDEQQARRAVRDRIAVGVAEIERGEGLDGDGVFRELMSDLDDSIGGKRSRSDGSSLRHRLGSI